ncbi:MAG: hypothetical protein IPN85_18840 [Flavobacteriales bacterium]|nr:hypothetical protein [Flavobacteriales bacterium]
MEPRSTIHQFVSRHPVTIFIALTLGFQLTIVLLAYGLMPAGSALHDYPQAHMVFRFRVFGPLAFAMGLTYFLEGRQGLVKLFSAFAKWRVPARWYALAFSWKFIVTYIGLGILAISHAPLAWRHCRGFPPQLAEEHALHCGHCGGGGNRLDEVQRAAVE